MSVRSFQTILEANEARKAAMRAKLLAIIDSGKSPDGVIGGPFDPWQGLHDLSDDDARLLAKILVGIAVAALVGSAIYSLVAAW